MSDHTERFRSASVGRASSAQIWRAGPVTLILVSAFALAAAVIIPVLAYLIYRNGSAL
jgi:hypothetical protein